MYSCDGDVESNSAQINCPLLDLAATEFLPGGPSSRGEGWGGGEWGRAGDRYAARRGDGVAAREGNAYN